VCVAWVWGGGGVWGGVNWGLDSLKLFFFLDGFIKNTK
jgi:hypothetical protein